MIIFDLDGVCAHSRWREGLIKTHGWDEFHSRCGRDRPNLLLRDMIAALSNTLGVRCIALTGRPESVRAQTIAWLVEHGFEFSDVIMRPNGDYRRSPELKVALMEEHFGPRWADAVAGVFDDREDVLAAFAAHSIATYHVTLYRDSVALRKGTHQ